MKSIITFVAVFTAMLFICLNLSGDSIDFIHITLEKSKAGASSTLAEKDKPAWYYGSDKAFDGLSETAWCEGKKDDGTGEYIYSEFEPFKTWGFTILNGFGGYRHLYFKNNRVKDFKLTLYTADGKIRIIKDKCKDDACGQALAGGKLTPEDFCQEEVPDYEKNKNKYSKCVADKNNECLIHQYNGGGQVFLLDAPVTVNKLKLEILSVYKGSKYSDTCIAEIRLIKNAQTYSE